MADRARLRLLLAFLAGALFAFAPAQSRADYACQSNCWTLTVFVADLKPADTGYRFEVVVGDDNVALKRTGGRFSVNLPRVMGTSAAVTGLHISLIDQTGTLLEDVDLSAPGYVRAPRPLEIPFYAHEMPETRDSVNALDRLIAGPGIPEASLWKAYFQGLLLLPDMQDSDFGGPLQRIIFRACSNLARTNSTFVFFRFDDNECHRDAPGVAQTELDDVDVAVWQLYKYMADPLSDGKPHTALEYGGIYRTFGWLHDLYGSSDMVARIRAHQRLQGLPPVPSTDALMQALQRAHCLAGGSCNS